MKIKIPSLKQLLIFLLPIILVVSNLGVIQNNQLRKGSLYFVFAFLVIIYLFKLQGVVRRDYAYLVLVSIVIIAYLMLVKDMGYSSDRVSFIVLDMGMIWIGMGIASTENEAFINKLLVCYNLVCSFLCVYYLMKFDTSLVYGYELKHCLAANILMSLVILMAKSNIRLKILRFLLMALHIVTIFNLNSRSTIISLIGVMLIMVVVERNRIKNFMKNGIGLLVVIVAIVLVCIFHAQILDWIKEALRIDTFAGIDLDRYSADRLPMLREGLAALKGNELLGVTDMGAETSFTYIESFPFDILVKLGFIGLFMYVAWFLIVARNLFTRKTAAETKDLAKLIFVALCIISLFQASAPMGPGTAYSFGWLIIGVFWKRDICNNM